MKPIDREDQRRRVFARGGYCCEVCGKPLCHHDTQPQLAHRIANTKANRKRYGAKVIDDDRNIAPVCSLACNDACNIGGRPEEARALARRILDSPPRPW